MGGYSAAAQGMYANQYEDENMYKFDNSLLIFSQFNIK